MMRKYEFKAITSGSDAIIALSYPVVFGFPIIALQFITYYFGLKDFFMSNRLIILAIIFSMLYCSYMLVKKIQQNLIKSYIVELDNDYINILENGEEILSGKTSYCEINDKSNRMVGYVSIGIYTEHDKITLRARVKEYRAITGVVSPNIFGTGDSSDLHTLISLGEEINRIVGEC